MIQSEKDYVKDLGVIVEVSRWLRSRIMRWNSRTVEIDFPGGWNFSGFHVQAGGQRDSRRHARERQDHLREHPADLRLAQRVSHSGIQTLFNGCSDSVRLTSWFCFSFFLVELERCVQNHDLLADLFIKHVSSTNLDTKRPRGPLMRQTNTLYPD